MLKILILTAFWSRPQISRLYWMGIERLKKSFDVKVMAICSDSENLELAKKYADYITEFPNEPIGKKMNVGLVNAVEKDFDVLMQLGSDDLITDNAVSKLQKYYKSGVKFFGLNNVAMVDSVNKQAGQMQFPNVFGSGRCIAKEVLLQFVKGKKIRMKQSIAGAAYNYGKGQIVDLPFATAKKWVERGLAEEIESVSMDNLFWPDAVNSGLDVRSEIRLEEIGLVCLPVMYDDPQLIAVKSHYNIWKYDTFKLNQYPMEKIKEKISSEEYEYLMSL